MKKTKIIFASLLTAFTAIPLTACKKKNDPGQQETDSFDFSIAVRSGRNQIEMGTTDSIMLIGDGVEDAGRNYVYESSNEAVATIDANGVITPVAPGTVSFQVTETSSNISVELPTNVDVVPSAVKATGGFNYSAANDVTTRTKILGKLEKYVMDAHLTGITLFDNGGYVKYHPRVSLPTTNYITGYGFGLLREGSLTAPLDTEETEAYKEFYHTAQSQDSLTINAMNASGSQVGDLSSYITSSYYGTKMAADKKSYEWYPILAKESVRKPIINDQGEISGYQETASAQTRPIPLEKHNDLGLYKKWRIYVKTGASDNLAYRKYTKDGEGNIIADPAWDKRAVSIDDYEFVYKFLLTGKNGMSRGSEMAGDTSYGIKGAQRFFNDTLSKDVTQSYVDAHWTELKNSGDLGLASGADENGNEYIDIELINPIDDFTAMYTLSSSLVSPLPRAFFESIGGGSIFDAAAKYGNFNDGGHDKILDYTLCLGPYILSRWTKKQLICFSRNDDWYEVKDGAYKIKGIYSRVIDTSTDVEAVYSQFNQGNLDVTGIPTSKIATEKNQERVYPTKGDSTFKLNVNSCTQEQWNYLFGKDGKINKNSVWNVKSWMSNDNFLNGLFFAINRKEFAEKRGVQPSINYFSDAYLSDPISGESYNDTQAHKDAVKNYHSIGADGEDNYGFDYGRAVQSFKAAVNELTFTDPNFVKGTRDNPLQISINICWMYPTDPKEYGEDISSYIESAFNDEAVCGGTVKLTVENDYVTNWEDVYNEKMMKGQFDLGFGAISGNTYNPLNFMEVLKTDNSSGFTLNWGENTADLSEKNPIYYDDGNGNKKWSFDALWAVADHGGIARDGKKVEPVQKCYKGMHLNVEGTAEMGDNLYVASSGGYKVEIPLYFEETQGVTYEFNRLVINAAGVGNVAIANATYDKNAHKIIAIVSETEAQKVDSGIYNAVYKEDGTDKTTDEHKWKLHPFLLSKYNSLWTYELYYTLTIEGARPTENYYTVKANKKAAEAEN